MQKTSALKLLAVAALALCAAAVQAAGLMTPEAGLGLAALGGAGMINYVQNGRTLTLTPAAAVSKGVGYLFGQALFGVAINDVAINTPGEFLTEDVVEIAKTNALAIAVGDRLYWDPAAKVVNKTAAAQQCVGVAVEAAANPSATVKMKIQQLLPVAT